MNQTGDVIPPDEVHEALSAHFLGMLEHDSGALVVPGTMDDPAVEWRQKQLLAELLMKYDVTRVPGGTSPREDKAEPSDALAIVLLVLDRNDTGTLEADLRQLAEKRDLGPLLFVPVSGREGILWERDGRWSQVPDPIFAFDGSLRCRTAGRPFTLENAAEALPCDYPRGLFGEWGRHAVIHAKRK
jgi:hypothetical protein